MKIMFVCQGNTCRSPMLKFMFEFYAKNNGLDIDVDSSGIMDHEKPMNENTAYVLLKNRIPFENTMSKYCSRELYDSKDLVFAMTKEIKDSLTLRYGSEDKIYGLYDILGKDIFDPYGLGIIAYEDVFEIFNSMLEKIGQIVKTKLIF